jgi:hypothetical protein
VVVVELTKRAKSKSREDEGRWNYIVGRWTLVLSEALAVAGSTGRTSGH